MSPRIQNQSAYVRELFAVTELANKFHHYLLGHLFIIRTYQQAIRHLHQQTIQTPEQQCWLLKLLGFDFIIEYKPCHDNLVPYAISRCFTLTFSQT